jgi:hypothetical protein
MCLFERFAESIYKNLQAGDESFTSEAKEDYVVAHVKVSAID